MGRRAQNIGNVLTTNGHSILIGGRHTEASNVPQKKQQRTNAVEEPDAGAAEGDRERT
jgi:hypothetical protein